MPFLGTIVNFSAVLIFGILGTLIKKEAPKRIVDAVMSAMAVCVIYIGIDGALEKPPEVSPGSLLSAPLMKILVMIISMGIGTLVGELLDFDRLVNKLGDKLESKLSGLFPKKDGEGGNFSKGFVTC